MNTRPYFLTSPADLIDLILSSWEVLPVQAAWSANAAYVTDIMGEIEIMVAELTTRHEAQIEQDAFKVAREAEQADPNARARATYAEMTRLTVERDEAEAYAELDDAEVNPIAEAEAVYRMAVTVRVLTELVLASPVAISVADSIEDEKEALVGIGVAPALLNAAGATVLASLTRGGGTYSMLSGR